MNKYLIDLATAFQSVPLTCYEHRALKSNGRSYRQSPENNFTAEIKHFFQNLMDKRVNNQYYKAKKLTLSLDTAKARLRIRPDLVLHQSPDNQTHQELFVEVKITSVSLFNDLRKLVRAISTDLHFKYGVMIVVNKSLQDTLNEIKEFLNNNKLHSKNKRKLILFHAVINNDSKTAKYFYDNFYSLKHLNI